MVRAKRTGAVEAAGVYLSDDLKLICSRCDGTYFQVEATTGNAGAKGVEGLYFLCRCGYEELIDFETLGATANYV